LDICKGGGKWVTVGQRGGETFGRLRGKGRHPEGVAGEKGRTIERKKKKSNPPKLKGEGETAQEKVIAFLIKQ